MKKILLKKIIPIFLSILILITFSLPVLAASSETETDSKLPYCVALNPQYMTSSDVNMIQDLVNNAGLEFDLSAPDTIGFCFPEKGWYTYSSMQECLCYSFYQPTWDSNSLPTSQINYVSNNLPGNMLIDPYSDACVVTPTAGITLQYKRLFIQFRQIGNRVEVGTADSYTIFGSSQIYHSEVLNKDFQQSLPCYVSNDLPFSNSDFVAPSQDANSTNYYYGVVQSKESGSHTGDTGGTGGSGSGDGEDISVQNNGILKKILDSLNDFKSKFKEYIGKIGDFLEGKAPGFYDFFSGITDSIKEKIQSFHDSVTSSFNQVKQFLSGIKTAITDFFGEFWGKITETVTGILDKLFDLNGGSFWDKFLEFLIHIFVPSEEDIAELKETFFAKTGLRIDTFDWIIEEANKLDALIKPQSGAPMIQLPSFDVMGEIIPPTYIDLSFLDPYIGYIHAILAAFIYISFFTALFKNLPNLISGSVFSSESNTEVLSESSDTTKKG